MDFKLYEKIYNQGGNISFENEHEILQNMEVLKTAIRMNEDVYLKLPETIKLNFEVALEFLKTHQFETFLPKELRMNEDFLLHALEEGFIIDKRNNESFYQKHVGEVAKAVIDGKLESYNVPLYLRETEEVALAYIKTGSASKLSSTYKFTNHNIIIEGLRTNSGKIEEYIDQSLFKDEKFIKKSLEEGVYNKKFEGEILKDKKYALLAAKNGASLSNLKSFENDDDIIRAVMEVSPEYYFQISENHPLKHDRDFIIAGLHNGCGLNDIPKNERQKKEYLDIAASSNVVSLLLADDEYLRNVENIRNIVEKYTGTHLSEECVRPYEFLSRFLPNKHYENIISNAMELTNDLIVRAENLNNEQYRKHITIKRKEAKECMRKLREAIIINAFPENIEELYKKGINNISNEELYEIVSRESRLGIVNKKITNYLECYKNLYDSYKNLIIGLDRKQITKDHTSNIKKLVDNCPDGIDKVKVCVDAPTNYLNNEGVNYTYTPQETKILNDLDRYLKIKKQDGVLLKEFGRVKKNKDLEESWSLDKATIASKKVDRVVERIKKMDLSPFETMLYIHKYAAEITYNKSKEGTIEKGRVLPSIANEPYMVCGGYSTLIKAIVDKLNMPGLKCDFLSCSMVKDLDNFEFYDSEGKRDFNKVIYHSHLLTKIEDDKYNIDGFYIEDACWDATEEADSRSLGFAHCLYPLKDLGHLKRYTKYIQVDFDDRYNSLLASEKEVDRIMEGHFDKKDQIENNIAAQLNNVMVSDVVKKYGSKSKPISIDSYKKGLETVMSKLYPESDDSVIQNIVEYKLKHSRERAKETFKETAVSSFSEHKEEVKEDKKQKLFSKIFKR